MPDNGNTKKNKNATRKVNKGSCPYKREDKVLIKMIRRGGNNSEAMLRAKYDRQTGRVKDYIMDGAYCSKVVVRFKDGNEVIYDTNDVQRAGWGTWVFSSLFGSKPSKESINLRSGIKTTRRYNNKNNNNKNNNVNIDYENDEKIKKIVEKIKELKALDLRADEEKYIDKFKDKSFARAQRAKFNSALDKTIYSLEEGIKVLKKAAESGKSIHKEYLALYDEIANTNDEVNIWKDMIQGGPISKSQRDELIEDYNTLIEAYKDISPSSSHASRTSHKKIGEDISTLRGHLRSSKDILPDEFDNIKNFINDIEDDITIFR
jgi:hypothetical protein